MLDIYKKFFDDLNEKEILYCVYKGLEHLQEDLKGARGDIDILLSEKDFEIFDTIALKNNFFKVKTQEQPYYYMGIDELTHKFVMLDVSTYIQFGSKPYKPYSVHLDMDKISLNKVFDRVQVLERVDYIPQVEKSARLEFKQKYRSFFGKLKAIARRLKSPSYKIRDKGFLVAFVGVDGAGKSSTVEYIQNLDFFKFTGVKRIYFGSNEYWIPGLRYMLKKEFNNKYMRLLLSSFISIDKQLRIIKALYYIYMGNIVLADRYYYDNEIGREMHKDKPIKKSTFRSFYRFIFEVRMLKKPDLTVFLDVSPEVAYARKQDYSYEKMLEVNRAYKEYMYKVDGVKIVNADEEQSKVYSEIVALILDLDRYK